MISLPNFLGFHSCGIKSIILEITASVPANCKNGNFIYNDNFDPYLLGTCSFICQRTSTRRQRSELFGVQVKLPPDTACLTTQRYTSLDVFR